MLDAYQHGELLDRRKSLQNQLRTAQEVQEKYWQFMQSQPVITTDMVKRYVSHCCAYTKIETELRFH